VLAPALIKAGQPELVAHMFVFYFATISVITPPVCVAVFVAAGSVAKQLLAQIGVEVRGEAVPADGADPEAVDAARRDRDTLGGVAEVRATAEELAP